MDASIIVCTRNRAPQLLEALEYFARLQSSHSFELIFVDNGSTDETGEYLRNFSERAIQRVKIVEEPRPGLSVARNAGWRASIGKVVIFTDDDCYPAVDFVDQVLICFNESEIGYLGGRVLLHDQADYPITIQHLDRRVDLVSRQYIPLGLIHGANFAFRRDLMAQVGLFDERLGAGTDLKCGEDIDYLARASALGWAGAYDPRPTVRHHHRRSLPEDIQRLLEGYDIGRGAYFAKSLIHGQMRGKFIWPVLRRVFGNLSRRDFGVLNREFAGAWKYLSRNG